jgi:hypothetical protein
MRRPRSFSTVVRELTGGDQRTEGPGVYLLPAERQFGLKPLRTDDGREAVPFEWATEFPPVGEFVQRFPHYWRAEPRVEVWFGGLHNPVGIYWVRYDPRSVGGSV